MTIHESELFTFLFTYAHDHHHSIAVWQLPESTSKLVVLSKEAIWIDRNTALEEMESGFLIAPFDREARSLFLPAELQFRVADGMVCPPSTDRERNSQRWLKENFKAVISRRSSYHSAPQENPSGEIDYIALVKTTIEGIERGEFEKVVPSRRKTVQLAPSFDVAGAFLKLCKAYPLAFVSLVSSPLSGTWMGASPEELVRIKDKTIFKTVALAGTQPYHEGVNLRNVAWTQKEIEEQALVERYIISCFKKIRLREYDEIGPKTVVAGNLMHLKSEFTVDMKETNFPQLGSTMLGLLHPTSAVCGVPLDPALNFLKQREGYGRDFYSGYLGPVNIDGQIDLFVNLRCTQLRERSATLYAGAGVTIDSIPEQEWEETEMKMNTLLRVINSER